MSESGIAGEVGQEDFTSPDRAIIPQAGPVAGESDDRPRLAVFCQTLGDIGVVVLDRHPHLDLSLQGVPGARVIGMQVMRQDLRT